MRPPSHTASPGLAAVLRGVVADLQRASGAEMVSIYLYEEAGRRYYAPFAVGQDEESLLPALADMGEQLGRYRADAEQGKVPDDLGVQQYGSTVWLTVTRRPLVAADARAEIDSTFIRRYQVASTVGLPLLAGDRLLGIVYFNYREKKGARARAAGSQAPTKENLAQLEKRVVVAASTIAAALVAAERSALEGVARLAGLLGAPSDQGGDPKEMRRIFSISLAELLLASDLDGAIIYELAGHGTRLDLVTAQAPAAAPPRIALQGTSREWESQVRDAVAGAMAAADLHPIAAFPLGTDEEPHGYLVMLSRDRLATVRRAPATDVMLRVAGELIGGALAGWRMINELRQGNKLLGALGTMTSAMLRPGSTRRQVLDAVVGHLTDASVTEFDFHFATVFLLSVEEGEEPVVKMAAGAARSAAISSTEVASADGGGHRAPRVPRWALDQERPLARNDVLVHVAGSWRAAVVGPASSGREVRREDVFAGPIREASRWLQVPVVWSDGSTLTWVMACLLGEGAESAAEPPFTLAGELYESSGHGELIRIFLPFGFDHDRAATGVLEVGYHRGGERRPDWGQVEALRAAAAEIAVAVETARLYEEARHHAEQLELSADVSEAIASSIDLDQTLALVARNLVRLVDASLCQIALYEEDRQGWFGAAASAHEDLWRRQRGERSQPSFLFDVLDRREAILVEDAATDPRVPPGYRAAFGVRSLLALPLIADGQPIGAAVLAQTERSRSFTREEVQLAQGLAHQAAVAIKNARLHALAEEERHLQKDFVLVGFGQWGQKAYAHLQTLKQFFNFRVHVVEHESPGGRERLAEREQQVRANGDAFYWDSEAAPGHDQMQRELEPSCYVITYIATPAATHLPTLALYHDLSDVVLVEKPLGSPPEDYRRFLETARSGVEIVAADHYYFKLEVRLLQLLLSEERTLRVFLDTVEEVRVEILEEQPLVGAAADIGVIADLIPHAFAIISLLTPIDGIRLDETAPLMIGRHDGFTGSRESFARMTGSFHHQGRPVRLVIEVGKGVENAKWIRLSGEARSGGRSPSYKFDFGQGEAIDGTQPTVRAAVRRIREPGVPDNAHLNMLRHVIEKRHPAVGILSIREAIRANQRVRDLEAMAESLLARGDVASYALGTRPAWSQHTSRGVEATSR
jgi:GAF domain-containing protein/predicted dehydrogenase